MMEKLGWVYISVCFLQDICPPVSEHTEFLYEAKVHSGKKLSEGFRNKTKQRNNQTTTITTITTTKYKYQKVQGALGA